MRRREFTAFLASAGATASLATIAGILSAGMSYAADTTYERLANPEPRNWLMHHHDYGAQRYSPLDTINRGNIRNMRLLFAVALVLWA